ncbi:MAG: hypothetical protein QW534_08620, partial [Candidatus Methanomethylicia archaeon]
VRLIGRMGDEGWMGMMGYGRRWAVETTFPTLNASMENTAWQKTWNKERTRSQAYIYNTLINL